MISLILIFGFLCRYPDDLRNIVQQCANQSPSKTIKHNHNSDLFSAVKQHMYLTFFQFSSMFQGEYRYIPIWQRRQLYYEILPKLEISHNIGNMLLNMSFHVKVFYFQKYNWRKLEGFWEQSKNLFFYVFSVMRRYRSNVSQWVSEWVSDTVELSWLMWPW